MKQKDFLVIAIVVIISGTASFFISNLVITPAGDKKQLVEVVDPISTDFAFPNSKYFNDKSVNPTETITIGGNNNTSPFDSSN